MPFSKKKCYMADPLIGEVGEKINQISEGSLKLRKSFNESKKKTLNKFVEETLLLGITLIQNIINRYQSLKIDHLSQFIEIDAMRDIKINMDREITLEHPSLTGREIIEGAIIFHVKHLALEADKFEMFDMIPVPNVKNRAILPIIKFDPAQGSPRPLLTTNS